jgi:hypothetical protein
MRDLTLKGQYDEAMDCYYDALNAVPFMPKDARPYTERTAQKYLDKAK